MGFKVGDKVIIRGNSPTSRGERGTIMEINNTTLLAFVKLDCGAELLIPTRFLTKLKVKDTVYGIIGKKLGIDACELEYNCMIICELVDKWHKKLVSCNSREEYAKIMNEVDKDLKNFNLTWGDFINGMMNEIELEEEIKKWNKR